jgi:predicted Zn-dependent protease
MGRPQEAIRELNRAVELDPLSPIIRSLLAQILSETGQNDKAVEEIRKVLEVDPDFAKGHRTLALIYERKRMYPEATKELNRSKSWELASTSLFRTSDTPAHWLARKQQQRRLSELSRNRQNELASRHRLARSP